MGLGWVTRRILFRMLEAWAEKSATRLDDILVQALRRPFLLWVTILALQLASEGSQLPPRAVAVVSKILLVLWIVSVSAVASKLVTLLIRQYGGGFAGALPITTLTENIASLAVAGVGLLILLNALGLSITPFLTALGVGGLAVALALQDTLSNLFAGFYISVAGQLKPGDYVKMSTGEEGYITDMAGETPRSARSRTI